jgi:DSF synthase
MQNNICNSLTQFYDQLVTEFNEETGVMWCYMNPYPRPCFTPQLLNDLNRFLEVIRGKVCNDIRTSSSSSIKYIVFGSYKPGVFSLGGDLSLFTECINKSDKDRLTDYMRMSIDVMYSIYTNMDIPITTISLIRGNALGAGFEGALSCDYIVAEKKIQLGFPEVLFNMFPGMGAYSFLARRLDTARAERMILSGRIYSAEELYDMGVIDLITEDGHGVQEVGTFIKKLEKSKNTRKAILDIRNKIHPITFEELLYIGEIWVSSAMALSQKEVKVMQRLVRSQDRMAKSLLHTAAVERINGEIRFSNSA